MPIYARILKFKANKKEYESISFFDKAVKADSAYSQAYFWRGLAYLSLDQTERCVMQIGVSLFNSILKTHFITNDARISIY